MGRVGGRVHHGDMSFGDHGSMSVEGDGQPKAIVRAPSGPREVDGMGYESGLTPSRNEKWKGRAPRVPPVGYRRAGCALPRAGER
jgi:hypothetical protein